MGTALVVTAGPVRSGSANKGKPRKMFRGVTRTLLRKSLAKMNALVNSDQRAWNRSLEVGYDVALITGMENSADGRAFARVIQRLKDCLTLKEGDK